MSWRRDAAYCVASAIPLLEYFTWKAITQAGEGGGEGVVVGKRGTSNLFDWGERRQ